MWLDPSESPPTLASEQRNAHPYPTRRLPDPPGHSAAQPGTMAGPGATKTTHHPAACRNPPAAGACEHKPQTPGAPLEESI